MKQCTSLVPDLTLGLDVGDRWIHVARVDAAGAVGEERVASSPAACRRYFQKLPRCRVVLEVGTHSRWLSTLLSEVGHEVFVANAGRLPAIHASPRKCDRNDALQLARLGRIDPSLLHPIQHRPEQMQEDLALLHTRDALVRSRTLLVNQARGTLKAAGHRPVRCSSEAFPKRVGALAVSGSSVFYLSAQVEQLTSEIKRFDALIETVARKRYPATALVRQIKGVGPITALAFVLILFDPKRFRRSRDVAAYLGLVSKKHQSGDSDPQLGITKAGNGFLRRLLVQAAHYILGPFGPECDLRDFGKRLEGRGGKAAKKRAVVAVARKLAITMHHLWRTAEVYHPRMQQHAYS